MSDSAKPRRIRAQTSPRDPYLMRFILDTPIQAGILNNGFRVGRTFADPDSDDIVENSQYRVMRGVSFVHSSAPNRTSYRVRYSPNFGMIPWGLRAARTID